MNFVIALALSLSSAAFAGQRPTVHWLRHLIPQNMRVRRPQAAPASPGAGPGGLDYESHPLPDARFDCEPVAALFKGVDLAGLRGCVVGLKPGTRVVYLLRREVEPRLELEDPDHAPPCLKQYASALPVPREIFFQSTDEGPPLCYSARVPIGADEFLGSKVPLRKTRVRVVFPPTPVPNTDDETRMLLLSWSLAPFWEERPRQFKATIVTDEICDACLGPGNRIGKDAAPPALWP